MMQTHSQTGTEMPLLILSWFVLQLVHVVSLEAPFLLGLVMRLQTESRMCEFSLL